MTRTGAREGARDLGEARDGVGVRGMRVGGGGRWTLRCRTTALLVLLPLLPAPVLSPNHPERAAGFAGTRRAEIQDTAPRSERQRRGCRVAEWRL
jgi:hypothetical protein